jgi:hypothetical protein
MLKSSHVGPTDGIAVSDALVPERLLKVLLTPLGNSAVPSREKCHRSFTITEIFIRGSGKGGRVEVIEIGEHSNAREVIRDEVV